MNSPAHRYSRQIRFAPMGECGQAELAKKTVAICGCGALGSVIAERLARSGVGRLRLIDRDWVELSNLQRQTLFHERHAAQAIPKSVAAAEVLAQINSEITIVPLVEDITFENIDSLLAGCDLIMDGTDNFETRFLINDWALKNLVPWVHGGCLGASGQILTIIPHITACFRCLVPDLPPREALQTCDSAGVLGPAVGLIACWQAIEGLKILSGNRESCSRDLIAIDLWNTDIRSLKLNANPNCPACASGDFPFYDGRIRSEVTILCGKNAVQIDSPSSSQESLEDLAKRMSPFGQVLSNPYFVRLSIADHVITVFRGGRTVIEGTVSVADAKRLVSSILGA
ncbi:MAG: ThiF family adenylyltransferase [Planctomycetales bacterium]|nr:ThiF family adenylyltransferase [Planctomycetales bacterium]